MNCCKMADVNLSFITRFRNKYWNSLLVETIKLQFQGLLNVR